MNTAKIVVPAILCFFTAIPIHAETTILGSVVKFVGEAVAGKLLDDLTSELYKKYRTTASDVEASLEHTEYWHKRYGWYHGTNFGWEGKMWLDINSGVRQFEQKPYGQPSNNQPFQYRWESLNYYCSVWSGPIDNSTSTMIWNEQQTSTTKASIRIKTVIPGSNLINNPLGTDGIASVVTAWDPKKRLATSCGTILSPDSYSVVVTDCKVARFAGGVRWTEVKIPLVNEYCDQGNVQILYSK